MNILVCFKIVPDLDQLSGDDWVVESCNRIETRFVKKMINPYDESALELALRLRDQANEAGLTINLTALTVSDSGANLTLKSLRALGYQKAARIETGAELDFSPEKIAALIAAYALNQDVFDLIIMGRQSGVGDNAKTPLLTAEFLCWPCITQVNGLESDTVETFKVRAIADEGIVTRIIKPPCVLAVGNAPCSNLRVPTLKTIKEQAGQPVITYAVPDLMKASTSLSVSPGAELLRLEVVNRKRRSIIIEGTNAAEKAGLLYHSYLKGWLAEL